MKTLYEAPVRMVSPSPPPVAHDDAPTVLVVGLDGSEESRAALAWAAKEAGRRGRGSGLRVVRVWHELPTHLSPTTTETVESAEAAEAEAADFDLYDTIGEHPDLAVERRIVRGPTGPALVEEATGAALLVVGSRGHGAVRNALLGSVASYCIAHAPCPVVVIPHTCDSARLG